jgi:hypothetical protein
VSLFRFTYRRKTSASCAVSALSLFLAIALTKAPATGLQSIASEIVR